MRILVTGATGNVGSEVMDQLLRAGHAAVAGTRDGRYDVQGVGAVKVDFAARAPCAGEYDAVFLMRPPQLADADLFEAFLDGLARDTRIVFLSVQGADRKAYLPHAKIEARIVAMGFAHVFVRPSYFMENLLTTLWPELQQNRRIYLPAGRLQFDWVSARDVACVIVAALTGGVDGTAITVCSGRRIGFADACAEINRIAGTDLAYRPASLAGFVRHARRKGQAWSYIGVMLLLHYLPRYGRPAQDDCQPVREVLGRDPETLSAFISRHAARFSTLRQPAPRPDQGGVTPPDNTA